ncbi:MAG: hypothetical protein WBA11_09280 [Rubrivirga sp.]
MPVLEVARGRAAPWPYRMLPSSRPCRMLPIPTPNEVDHDGLTPTRVIPAEAGPESSRTAQPTQTGPRAASEVGVALEAEV